MTTLLNDIPFTSPIAHEVRNILNASGCKTDDDIIKLGCTGLINALAKIPSMTFAGNALTMAIRVRENMDGSGCGLPCYVPPTRFCLVHSTVGGLQHGQAQRNPEGVSRCSRELSAGESLHARVMQAAIDQEGLREAKARFGLEGVEGLLPLKSSEDESEDESECEGFGSRVLGGKPSTLGEITAPYTCAEHKEVDWACRFCLAAAILNGPVVPEMVIQADDDASYKTDQLKGVLAGQYGDPDRIRVLVCAARWDHTVVRKW